MRTLLICHEKEHLNRIVLPRWLASFSTLAGVIVVRETGAQKRRRARRELQRVGFWRFLDVMAFRLYYSMVLARRDSAWEENRVRELCQQYPEISVSTPTLVTASPNSPEAFDFVRNLAPDIVIARCKFILKEKVFTIPKSGTFVMHPGICPEYRNAHGCFWALANDDPERVGMTLLRIDAGIDTGPVLGYFHCSYDTRKESHIVIQHRTVFDNLEDIKQTLLQIHTGETVPIDVSGRHSATWGQPWLTKYFHIKRVAARS
jgi:folate-dependent phosphoribosylglycinamide formyltransferase PurN